MSLLKPYPRSAAQIAAMRLNGRKSRGPITPAGKANSSQNALRHGFHAASPVIKGEDPAAFHALLSEFHATYSPVGLAEELCIFHMASAQWKLLRATLYETDLINEHMDHDDSSSPSPELTSLRRTSHALNALESRPHSLTNLRFQTTALERSFERNFRQLLTFQALRLAHPVVSENEPTNSLSPKEIE